MTPDQKRLVQESWALAAPDPAGAAALFYDRLFTIDPTLRVMFATTDVRSQGAKLMEKLSVAVRSRDRLDTVLPALVILGRDDATYGVTDSDRAAVGAALLWTLERGLGHRFTDEVRDAWAAAYTAPPTSAPRRSAPAASRLAA